MRHDPTQRIVRAEFATQLGPQSPKAYHGQACKGVNMSSDHSLVQQSSDCTDGSAQYAATCNNHTLSSTPATSTANNCLNASRRCNTAPTLIGKQSRHLYIAMWCIAEGATALSKPHTRALKKRPSSQYIYVYNSHLPLPITVGALANRGSPGTAVTAVL